MIVAGCLAEEFDCVFVFVFVRLFVSVSCVGSSDSFAVAVAVELENYYQSELNLDAASCDAAVHIFCKNS